MTSRAEFLDRLRTARHTADSVAPLRPVVTLDVVPDVEKFPGHIACDHASRSEIVVPLLKEGRLFGVLDLDSPNLARFDNEDEAGLQEAVRLLLAGSDLGRLAD